MQEITIPVFNEIFNVDSNIVEEIKGIKNINIETVRIATNKIVLLFLFSEKYPPAKYPVAKPPNVIANTADHTYKELP